MDEEKSSSSEVAKAAKPELNEGRQVVVDTEKEKRLIKALDWHIVPIIMMLYLFSFLDRVNVGNARLYGLEEDLGLMGSDYQLSVSIFFVTYCIFEVPSNLVIKKLRPAKYLGVIAIIWGIIATLTGLVQSLGSLIAVRLILGIVEAGLFPGVVTYLTIFYGRDRLALRISYLFVSAALAGALGGLLAYGIGFMDGIQGLRGWRWIMIIEGFPSVITGILCLIFMPDDMDSIKFFTQEERDALLAMRSRESGQTVSGANFHWKDVKEGAKDWKIWIFCVAAFCLDTMLYGFSVFLPTIIDGIGSWSTAEVQALTVPVYALGAITYLTVAWMSDKQQLRGPYAAGCTLVSAVGYAVLCSQTSAGAGYTGCFLISLGLYSSIGIALAWLPSNCPRYGKRTLATGMQLTWGNLSGVPAPFLFTDNYKPQYYIGYGVTIGLLCLASAIFVFMHFYWKRINKNRAEGLEDWKAEGKSTEEIEEMGDLSPRYVFNT